MMMKINRRLITTAASCTASPPPLPPVVWTYLPNNLPYHLGLLLQETLVARRHVAKKIISSSASSCLYPPALAKAKRTAETDVLLLLQHTPVYTAGRREKDPLQLENERLRLQAFGADHVSTMRGGETTYHGPGQLVGYSIMDIGAAQLSTRCYVSHMETFLASLARSLGVHVHPIEHTGVFVSPTLKIGSIGIHIRRRITLHGFSINIEEQTLPWFRNIVACGLNDVSATSMQSQTNSDVKVPDVLKAAITGFGYQYGREMRQLDEGNEEDKELAKVIADGIAGKLPPLEGL